MVIMMTILSLQQHHGGRGTLFQMSYRKHRKHLRHYNIILLHYTYLKSTHGVPHALFKQIFKHKPLIRCRSIKIRPIALNRKLVCRNTIDSHDLSWMHVYTYLLCKIWSGHTYGLQEVHAFFFRFLVKRRDTFCPAKLSLSSEKNGTYMFNRFSAKYRSILSDLY